MVLMAINVMIIIKIFMRAMDNGSTVNTEHMRE